MASNVIQGQINSGGHVTAPRQESSDSESEEESESAQTLSESESESGEQAEFRLPGYDKFKEDLAGMLTPDIIRELASSLEYQSDVTCDLNYDDEAGVGHVMISKMEEAGDLEPRNISALTDALKVLQYGELARDVASSYEKTVSKTAEYTGKTEIFIEGLKAVYREMIESLPTVCFQKVEHRLTDVFVWGNLERLEEAKSDMEPEIWTDVASNQELLEDQYNRVVLEGEPGYGKSTTCIQLVHEWCESMYAVDVVIFLRLRELGNLSLMQAIRLFTLPKKFPLTEEDIRRIMSSRQLRVLFVFDGYDEYTNIGPKSDIVAILKSKMYPAVRVITTTRAAYMEEILGVGVTRMRFKGFDEESRKRYMEKALGSSSRVNIKSLMRSLTERSLLVDLCQIPFFFAHFTHILAKFRDLPNLQTVTGYMKYLVDCCFNAELNGDDARKVHEDEVTNLARIAFESLKAVNRDYMWNLIAFQKTTGHRCCQRFTEAGILVVKGSTIKFFHSYFQEYLAALYMLHLVKSGNQFLLQNSIDDFKPKELKFMFLFGCGLNKEVATILINFFLNYDTYVYTMRLCLLDVKRNVPPLVEAVRMICEMYVSICVFEHRLAHRSIVNVLRIASKNKIPVTRLWMVETFGTADPVTGDIVLRTGMALPRLPSVRQIVIGTERGREISMDEWIGLLKYAGYSKKIENLDMYWCLLPYSISPRNIPMSLKSKRLDMKWGTLLVVEHKLDLHTGRWQGKLNHLDMPKHEYEHEVAKFRDRFREEKWKRPYDELSDGFARLLQKTDPYQ